MLYAIARWGKVDRMGLKDRARTPSGAVVSITILTILFLFLSVFSLVYSERWPGLLKDDPFGVAMTAALLLFCVAIFAFFLPTREVRIAAIIAGYFGLIFVFAGAYFALVAYGDLADSTAARSHFERQATLMESERRPRAEDLRAFRGVQGRLWTTVEVNTEGS